MPDLTLERAAAGGFVLPDVGTLHRLGLTWAEIAAGGEHWTLRRSSFGVGQIVNAKGSTGERVARYVPRGWLHLRGIFGGTITAAPRSFDWRANHQLGTHFTLSEHDQPIAELHAGSPVRPVQVEIADLGSVPPLVLLFCCYLVKQGVDAARMGRQIGPLSALGR